MIFHGWYVGYICKSFINSQELLPLTSPTQIFYTKIRVSNFVNLEPEITTDTTTTEESFGRYPTMIQSQTESETQQSVRSESDSTYQAPTFSGNQPTQGQTQGQTVGPTQTVQTQTTVARVLGRVD